MAEPEASSQKSAPRRVAVLLPYPLGPYDYSVPADMDLVAGDYVRVPLGPREILGVVWGEGAGDVAAAKMKPVAGRSTRRRCPKHIAALSIGSPATRCRRPEP